MKKQLVTWSEVINGEFVTDGAIIEKGDVFGFPTNVIESSIKYKDIDCKEEEESKTVEVYDPHAENGNKIVFGLPFVNKGNADKFCKQIYIMYHVMRFIEDNDDGWVADWDDFDQGKITLTFNQKHKKVGFNTFVGSKNLGVITMSKQCAEKLKTAIEQGRIEPLKHWSLKK